MPPDARRGRTDRCPAPDAARDRGGVETGRTRSWSPSSVASTRFIDGQADEGSHEEILRGLVEPLRHVDLDDPAVAHHRDTVTQRHRLGLVVRDVDAGDGEPSVQLRQRRAHADAELGVEVRQWLVHQKGLRLADDRPAHRHALPLPAGEVARAYGRGGPRARAASRLPHTGSISRFGVRRTLSPKPRFSRTFICG